MIKMRSVAYETKTIYDFRKFYLFVTNTTPITFVLPNQSQMVMGDIMISVHCCLGFDTLGTDSLGALASGIEIDAIKSMTSPQVSGLMSTYSPSQISVHWSEISKNLLECEESVEWPCQLQAGV